MLHDLRVPLGWWEAKNTADDLDTEIARKLRRGDPQDNIVFENTTTAVLYQNGAEIARCAITDAEALDRLLTRLVCGQTRHSSKMVVQQRSH